MYRGLEIGSAKPSAEQRKLVPHHLLDVVDPDAFYTAGDYSRAAREAIAGIVARGRLPIVTGGTGLYLRALLQGLFSGRNGRRPCVIACCARWKRGSALLTPDSQTPRPSFSCPHPCPRYCQGHTSHRGYPGRRPAHVRGLEGRARRTDRLPRTAARPRSRAPAALSAHQRPGAAMFAQGLIEETRSSLPAMAAYRRLDSLGYRQAAQYLDGMPHPGSSHCRRQPRSPQLRQAPAHLVSP